MRWVLLQTTRGGGPGESACRHVRVNAGLVAAVEDASFPVPASRIVFGGGHSYYVRGTPAQVIKALSGGDLDWQPLPLRPGAAQASYDPMDLADPPPTQEPPR